MSNTLVVSVRGQPRAVPVLHVAGVPVLVRGRALRQGRVFDAFWMERDRLPPLSRLLPALADHPQRPDLLHYTQRVPDTEPLWDGPHRFENFAVLPLHGHDHWLREQINPATRRNIRLAHKGGVAVRASDFDDAYVRGIQAIYDETPFRAGRTFWHYGKPLDAVARENGTYAERSTFLAAEVDGRMVGYMKIVWDVRTAAVMQILSMTSARNLRVNNALMSEAVRLACERGIGHLVYEHYDYGGKSGDSLTEFKQRHGFVRMDVPSYCIALTARGRLALSLSLDRSWQSRIPEPLAAPLRRWRTALARRRAGMTAVNDTAGPAGG